MKLKKAIYIVIGCIGVGLGAVGAVLPFLPAFPFLLVAAICFGKSSQRLDSWFKGTKLYKKNLETYVRGQGMTWAAKLRVLTMITILMVIGAIIMYVQNVPIPAMCVLAVVWLFHIVYFVFFVKKYNPNEKLMTGEEILEEKMHEIEDRQAHE